MRHHGHPSDVHTIEESFLQVVLHFEVNSGQAHHDIFVSILNHFGVLTEGVQDLLRAAHDDDEGDEGDRVDESTPIKILSAKFVVSVFGSVGLRHQCLDSTIQTEQRIKTRHINERGAEADPC